MLTADQLARRKQGIGASEVGAILGLSKYRTALDVYMDKLGLTEPSEDSEAAEWGHRLEPVIADKYALAYPGTVLVASDTVGHQEHPWALATPDRLVYQNGDKWLLEIKTREAHTAGEFGEPGTDEVPHEVAVQCQWQMFVTGLGRCDVALLVNGRRFTVYHLTSDAEIQQTLFATVERFWRDHVLAQEPPSVVAQDNPTLAKLFPKQTGTMLDGTLDDLALVKDIADLKSEAKALDLNINEREAQVKLRIGLAEGLTFPNGSKATWKANKDSEVTDWKAIAAEYLRQMDGTEQSATLAAHTTTKPGARVLRISVKED